MSFEELQLIEPILKAIDKQGYKEPTEIQEKAIPSLLRGNDLVGIAQTGTGKTAAFVLPLLQRMVKIHKVAPPKTPRALILAPTRELAIQIAASVKDYGKFLQLRYTAIYGGVSQKKQAHDMKSGVEIVIATPGRLLDLMNQGFVDLSRIEFLVLDEADRMLDMGFLPDMRKIINKLPKEHQTLLFSATMSKAITKLAKDITHNNVYVDINPKGLAVEKIDQKLIYIHPKDKNPLLLDLVSQEHLTSTLVFTRTKHKANKVAMFLIKNGIKADAIHSNKSQNQRTRALSSFKDGKLQVLVATDVAARGIDVDNISHVINYDLPDDPENYVHRIGRTARAGAEGTAYSFCSSQELKVLRVIQKLIGHEIEPVKYKISSKDFKPPQKKSKKKVHYNNRYKGKRKGRRR